MATTREPWALVLAAGEGTRLRSLTTDAHGNSTPKQFCSLNGGRSLLQLAFRRAARVVPSTRIITVVAAGHERWWRGETAGLPPENVVVQPENRGTAIGALLPLLRIQARDPNALVVMLPSDHFVAREELLASVMRVAVTEVAWRPERVVLLGIVPDEPDGGFGWIVPDDGARCEPRRVTRFVEKPPVALAAELMGAGGLWNSFILAAGVRTLLELFERSMPREVMRLRLALGPGRSAELAASYRDLPSRDFCRDLLELHQNRLAVLPVPRCGWNDLGTPERLARCVRELAPNRGPVQGGEPELPDLARVAAGA
jgi:mannose-1-phosphate guanylyltransferase